MHAPRMHAPCTHECIVHSCNQCSQQSSSVAGSTTCDICAINYYKDLASTPSEECKLCESALRGVICPELNTTLSTVNVTRGWWRLSEFSTDFRECEDKDGVTPCEGGVHVGTSKCVAARGSFIAVGSSRSHFDTICG